MSKDTTAQQAEFEAQKQKLLKQTQRELDKIVDEIADARDLVHGVEQYERRKRESELVVQERLAEAPPRIGEVDDPQIAAWRTEFGEVYEVIAFDGDGSAHFSYFRELRLEDYIKASKCKDIDVEIFASIAPGMFIGGSSAVLENFRMQLEVARPFIVDVFAPRGAAIKKK